jgi:iron complex outermembrane recepter protein
MGLKTRICRTAGAAALGLLAFSVAASAQDQGATPPVTPAPATAETVPATPPVTQPVPPAATSTPPAPTESTSPPAAVPPATTTPQAGQTTAPPTSTPPASTSPASTSPDGAVQQLPEVKIIQEQPKPPPAPPVEEAAPKVVKKPAPVVQSEPEAAPAPPPKKIAAKPKPVQQAATPPKPKPVQQAQPAAAPAAVQTEQAPVATSLATGIKMSPIGGSEIPLVKVPGSVGRATQEDIQRTGATGVQDVLQTSVAGVIVTDLQGNGFQTNVQYRGFESSPVNGVPQGLAIYQNGVRINESFGDIVNWDFLPSNAINDISVVANNPVFGLNAIGGAISIAMKDGFNYQGSEVDARFGSFGREQISYQTGQRSGAVAAYLAVEGANDDGWRDNSESRIRRMYADLGYKDEDVEFHVNFTGAKNFVGAVTAAPVELLALDYARTFTSPQVTNNDVKMVSANGTVSVTDTLKLSGIAYHRSFNQNRIDANLLDAADCGGVDAGTLCLGGDQALGAGAGVNPDGTIPSNLADVYGSIDNTSQKAKGYGVALQGVEKSKLFNLGNQFLAGVSYDHGDVLYGAKSALGVVVPGFIINPLGIDITGPNDLSPRRLTTTNDYYGLYFSDTLDVTDQLAVTVGGRYNIADLSIRDLTGKDPFLNADNSYSRFNPMVGATYAFSPGLSLYGSYSEANRAPTPAELACADPLNPCLIESFLTADPPLKQVVTRTQEIGLRGEEKSWSGHEHIEWSAGLFHALNSDDIITISAPTSGRGFFQNAGETLRQGVEASVSYRSDRIFMYANYNYVDATFNTPIAELPSPNSPSPNAFDCTGSDPLNPVSCVAVQKGDRLPGIAAHKFKAGFDYWVTPQWTFGADMIAASNQIFEGDQGNDNKPLGGYAKFNLHTSYDITDKIQIYGLIDNLFDTRYGLFGNYFDLAGANEAALGKLPPFTDARTVVPGAPFAIYGGLKVKF